MSMNSDAKKEYDILKESGELKEFLPGSTGEWTEDKKEFIKLFEENQKIIADGMNLHKLLEDNDDDYDGYPDW